MENICDLSFRSPDIYGNQIINKNLARVIYHKNTNFDFQLQMDQLSADRFWCTDGLGSPIDIFSIIFLTVRVISINWIYRTTCVVSHAVL